MMHRFRPSRRILAALTTVGLIVGLGVAATVPAYAADDPFTDAAPAILPAVPATIAAVDSVAGRGDALTADTDIVIDLTSSSGTASPAAAHSALVRLSVFQPAEPIDVVVAGAPALTVAKAASASTTLLVPLSDGTFTARATGDADLRVEVLALFDGDTATPGQTVALAAPVMRAELDAATLRDGTIAVGLTGLGGVPGSGIRAAHVTATVVAESATDVVLDGQRLSVPLGTTMITTVVTPSPAGDIDLDATGAAHVRIDVRGYVAEAEEYLHNPGADGPAPHPGIRTGTVMRDLNRDGAYWPAEAAASTSTTVTDARPEPIEPRTAPGAAYVLALVEATPAVDLTLLELGSAYSGRARGMVVDDAAGAQSQLALILTDDPVLTLRRGESSVTILELGAILGPDAPAAPAPTITVTSPATDTVDASAHLWIEFAGTAGPADIAPQRIEVWRGDTPLGTAAARIDGDTIQWRFSTAVPESGRWEFDFVLVGRSGERVTATWAGEIILPAPDDVVTTPETVVIGDAQHPVRTLAVSADSVLFATDPGIAPGQVIVSDVSEGAPEGFLRRVVAVEATDEGWLVTTSPATLEDVFLQVDFALDPDAPPTEIETIVHMDEPEQVPDGVVTTSEWRQVPLDELDIAPFPGDPIEPEGEEVIPEPHPTPAAMASRMIAPMADNTTKGGLSAGWTFEEEFEDTIAGFDFATSISGALKASLTVTIKAEIKWWGFIPYPSLTEFTALAETDVKVEGSITLTGKASWSPPAWNPKLGTITLAPPITFALGPIPVVITGTIDIGFKAQVKVYAEVELTVESGFQRKQKHGVSYKDGKNVPVDSVPKITEKPFKPEAALGITGAFEASAGPSVSLKLKLWDTIGTSIGVSMELGVSMETTSEASKPLPVVEVKVFLKSTQQLKFVLEVPIIGYELVNTALLSNTLAWTIWEWEYDFADLFPDPEETGFPTDPYPGPMPKPGFPTHDWPGWPGPVLDHPGGEPMELLLTGTSCAVWLGEGDDAVEGWHASFQVSLADGSPDREVFPAGMTFTLELSGGASLPWDYEAQRFMEWQTNEERTVMDLKLIEPLPTWMGISISEVALQSGEAATFTVTHIPGGGSVTPASLTMDEFQPPCG